MRGRGAVPWESPDLDAVGGGRARPGQTAYNLAVASLLGLGGLLAFAFLTFGDAEIAAPSALPLSPPVVHGVSYVVAGVLLLLAAIGFVKTLVPLPPSHADLARQDEGSKKADSGGVREASQKGAHPRLPP